MISSKKKRKSRFVF